MGWGLEHCTWGSNQNHLKEKEMQEGKEIVWGGLTNSWEKKEKQKTKEKEKDMLKYRAQDIFPELKETFRL